MFKFSDEKKTLLKDEVYVLICIYSLLILLRQDTWLWCVRYKIHIRNEDGLYTDDVT